MNKISNGLEVETAVQFDMGIGKIKTTTPPEHYLEDILIAEDKKLLVSDKNGYTFRVTPIKVSGNIGNREMYVHLHNSRVDVRKFIPFDKVVKVTTDNTMRRMHIDMVIEDKPKKEEVANG